MKHPVKSVVILTGAGISAESGIQTFRASDGLWENHRIEDVATPEGFQRDPVLVHHFYNERRKLLLSDRIKPNQAHLALARFERDFTRRFGGEFLIITQNIDNLHERAGSQNVLHMHGELLKMRCAQSQLVFDTRQDINIDQACRCCLQIGNLRPHIVWFGEIPFHMQAITRALENCDLFIAIGTSGNVYPAAGFHELAKAAQAHTVELNLERTHSIFDQHYTGKASRLVPDYLRQLTSFLSSDHSTM